MTDAINCTDCGMAKPTGLKCTNCRAPWIGDKTQGDPSALIGLLACPFCGGDVVEVQPAWNLANAQCVTCSEEWGHCGIKYELKHEKFNKRAG